MSYQIFDAVAGEGRNTKVFDFFDFFRVNIAYFIFYFSCKKKEERKLSILFGEINPNPRFLSFF